MARFRFPDQRMNPLRLLREIHWSVLALQAQGNRIERDLGEIMANQADEQAAIDALAASEKALIQRVKDNTAAQEANAARLQQIIDNLPTSPDTQPHIDQLNALKADMDAAAQVPVPEPTPTP